MRCPAKSAQRLGEKQYVCVCSVATLRAAAALPRLRGYTHRCVPRVARALGQWSAGERGILPQGEARNGILLSRCCCRERRRHAVATLFSIRGAPSGLRLGGAARIRRRATPCWRPAACRSRPTARLDARKHIDEEVGRNFLRTDYAHASVAILAQVRKRFLLKFPLSEQGGRPGSHHSLQDSCARCIDAFRLAMATTMPADAADGDGPESNIYKYVHM